MLYCPKIRKLQSIQAIRFCEKCGFRFGTAEKPVILGTENAEHRTVLTQQIIMIKETKT